MQYKNAGISMSEDEIRMADELAKVRHLSGRTALVRQWLWEEWERVFGQPNQNITVMQAQKACPTALMDQEQG